MSDKVTALFPGSAAADAERPASSMLREWADQMDRGELACDAVVLVVYSDMGGKFCVSHRRHRADVMTTTAMLEIAKHELLSQN